MSALIASGVTGLWACDLAVASSHLSAHDNGRLCRLPPSDSRKPASAPEHAVAPLLERLRHSLLCRFRVRPGAERADPAHQVPSQPDTVAVRFPRRELSPGLVLIETVFGRVRRLPDVERCQRARLFHTRARELDDVDRIAAARRLP